MKITLLAIVLVLISSLGYTQQTEIQVQLNSGLFSFSGPSAESTSFVHYKGPNYESRTNNPFGARPGLSVGISGNIKRVTKRNVLLGVDLGYEILRSRTKIDRIGDYSMSETISYFADGRTFLNLHFINVNPYAGYRASILDLPVDFTAGFDVGYCIGATERGKGSTPEGIDFETNLDRSTLKFDVRPRLQVATRFNKVGAYLGYSLGLANYKSDYIGGTNEAYARFFRFGLTYQLK